MRMRDRRLTRPGISGWTLVELTIVISIIVILAAMALAGYRSAIRARKKRS